MTRGNVRLYTCGFFAEFAIPVKTGCDSPKKLLRHATSKPT